MNKLIQDIINFEWNEFQKVQNVGGRASCQDNWRTFEIARKSQFLSWNEEMLKSYYDDLLDSEKQGRNLLTEKYAYMMENTAPEQYDKIKDRLPAISDNKSSIIEKVISIRVKWAEEFACGYPNISGNGRYIHSYEDSIYDTSMETYLRGELRTYSEKTINLYYNYVIQLKKQELNLSKIIMEHTASLYGYKSLDEAEKGLNN
ncbi:MAG: DUF4125 family protein [Tissierellia bacterium]|nr:DUF4125 family protein [Tissierellia bacterium]MDD4780686.1 DUF4125 family protein [Tissierellia bacterium]